MLLLTADSPAMDQFSIGLIIGACAHFQPQIKTKFFNFLHGLGFNIPNFTNFKIYMSINQFEGLKNSALKDFPIFVVFLRKKGKIGKISALTLFLFFINSQPQCSYKKKCREKSPTRLNKLDYSGRTLSP